MKDTRGQLLESACHVFAEVGFHDASIAEICERANANIASVNYYFRSKKALYVEALEYSFAIAERKRPLLLSADDIPKPEDRLRQFIDAQFHRIFCSGMCGCASKLVAHEMTNPTFAHETDFLPLVTPRFECLGQIVGELLEQPPDSSKVKDCVLSVLSMFSFYQYDETAHQELLGGMRETPERLRNVVAHTTEFALAGIAAMRGKSTERPKRSIKEMASARS